MKTMPFSVINSDNVLCFNFGGEINYNEHVHYLEYFLVFDPVKKRKKKQKSKRKERMHYVELISSGKLPTSGGEDLEILI